MKNLRLASFGMRGFVGLSLSPKAVMNFTSAFATFVEGGRVLVGRDTRHSSPMLHSATTASLLSAGCDVRDLGVCPTSILQFFVKRYKAAGAISVSGGHDSMGWNAITLMGRQGAILEPLGGERVLEIYHAGDFLKQDWEHMGEVTSVGNYQKEYFDELEKHVNGDALREANLTVLIDPVGGAGCPFLQAFALRFNLNLVPINAEQTGYLARDPEPRPRNAAHMASIIQHVKGDVGFVLSSDMSRLSVVSEAPEPASEEFTFALIANHVLGKKAGTIVMNCCTTRMIDDIAEKWHANVVRSRVGQAFVVSAMEDEGAVLGGEGSGSAILPAFSLGSDGFLMMALIMEAMVERKVPISELLNELPRYHIVKRNVPCESSVAYHSLDMLKTRLADITEGTIDLTDGIRVDWEDGWIHARASRTQELVRIISESRDQDMATQRAEKAVRIIGQGV